MRNHESSSPHDCDRSSLHLPDLAERLGHEGPERLAITGGLATGKTSSLRFIARQLLHREPPWLPIWIDVADWARGASTHLVDTWMALRWREHRGVQTEIVTSWARRLDQHQRSFGERRVLILDDLGALKNGRSDRTLNALLDDAERTFPRCSIVASCSPPLFLDLEEPHGFRILEIPPLEDTSVISRILGWGIDPEDERVTHTVEFLSRHSTLLRGNPLALQLTHRALVAGWDPRGGDLYSLGKAVQRGLADLPASHPHRKRWRRLWASALGDDPIQRYLRGEAERHRHLDERQSAFFGATAFEVPLDAVFIPPRLEPERGTEYPYGGIFEWTNLLSLLEHESERTRSEPTRNGTGPCIVIFGDPSIGKSTLLRHLTIELADAMGTPYIPVLLRLAGLGSNPDLWNLVEDLVVGPENELSSPETARRKEVVAALRGASEEGRIAWLLDGLDEYRGNAPLTTVSTRLCEQVRTELTKGCAIIAVGRRGAALDLAKLATLRVRLAGLEEPSQQRGFLERYAMIRRHPGPIGNAPDPAATTWADDCLRNLRDNPLLSGDILNNPLRLKAFAHEAARLGSSFRPRSAASLLRQFLRYHLNPQMYDQAREDVPEAHDFMRWWAHEWTRRASDRVFTRLDMMDAASIAREKEDRPWRAAVGDGSLDAYVSRILHLGLIKPAPGGYEFLHAQFRECLAGDELASLMRRQPNARELRDLLCRDLGFSRRVDRDRWRECLVFAPSELDGWRRDLVIRILARFESQTALRALNACDELHWNEAKRILIRASKRADVIEDAERTDEGLSFTIEGELLDLESEEDRQDWIRRESARNREELGAAPGEHFAGLATRVVERLHSHGPTLIAEPEQRAQVLFHCLRQRPTESTPDPKALFDWIETLTSRHTADLFLIESSLPRWFGTQPGGIDVCRRIIERIDLKFNPASLPASTFIPEFPQSSHIPSTPFDFTMGSNAPGFTEGTRRIRITTPYDMAVDPVLDEVFHAFTGREPDPGRRGHPATLVSWFDAMMFARWLSRHAAESGFIYDLPSEAEWEFASRGWSPTDYEGRLPTRFWWGDDEQRLLEVAHMQQPGGSTRAVEQGIANPFGLREMYGNVWEWCLDEGLPFYWDSDEAAATRAQTSTRTLRARRGGSFLFPSARIGSTCRDASRPWRRSRGFGFRLVRRPPRDPETSERAR
ncbi:MAG: SUMF1/EgtB/PvdO family nonheme iron enzyme [Planctomycetes bacterium]|nr:SUMF1/EgtB/PvdO family nonheme iron enzyme [Planctomycetota bacterium]